MMGVGIAVSANISSIGPFFTGIQPTNSKKEGPFVIRIWSAFNFAVIWVDLKL
jgi:hypothetical protein